LLSFHNIKDQIKKQTKLNRARSLSCPRPSCRWPLMSHLSYEAPMQVVIRAPVTDTIFVNPPVTGAGATATIGSRHNLVDRTPTRADVVRPTEGHLAVLALGAGLGVETLGVVGLEADIVASIWADALRSKVQPALGATSVVVHRNPPMMVVDSRPCVPHFAAGTVL
jgi:hypothetical protein